MTASTTSPTSPKSSTGQQLRQIFDQCLALFEERNAEYGDSWRGRTDLMGIFCKIEGKTDRLYQQVWQTGGKPPAGALDSARDNIVFNALLIVRMLEQEALKVRC